MCGIVGFNWGDRKKVQKLANWMTHRGPDQEGYMVNKEISLGHKRLSILDLSVRGKQPMSDSKKEIFIVFNGEIYNFQEIKEELISLGYKFKSNTDTEVIIYAYIEYGKDCLQKFNGQFAFCIYNKKNKELFLARDRLGIKPLYYYFKKDKFMFSSELKALIKSGDIEKKINNLAMNHFLFMGYPHLESSMIENVRKILPGHYMIYNLKQNKIKEYKRYWFNKFKLCKFQNEKEIEKQIIKLFDKSIKRRMIADRPVGAFLSGGVDSSLIVAFMSKHIKQLETFSISFDHKDYDESKYANIVSKRFKTKHHEMKFTSKDVEKFIPQISEIFDEPLADRSTIPSYLLAMVAKKNVTVALSGAGGDELFAGYKRYQHYNVIKFISKIPKTCRVLLKGLFMFVGVFSVRAHKLGLLFDTNEKEYALYPKLFSYFSKTPLNLDSSFIEGFKKYFKKGNVIDTFIFDQSEYLPSNLLFKDDIDCMAHSLEGRFPFLDHDLVEFANSIPLKYKIKGGNGKYILKKVASKYLSKEIIYRKKQSFSVPFNLYFKKGLKDFAYDNIFNFKGMDYYDKNIMMNCWNDHQNGKKDYSDLFWTIIVFNLWYKKWMN